MGRRRYFFIVGTGRSGTTLLQSMLSRAPGVFIPAETHFMALVYERRRTLGDITTDAGWQAAIRLIHHRNTKAGIKVDAQRFESIARDGPRTYATLLTAWLRAAAEHATAPDGATPHILGEKSPRHLHHTLELLAMLPDARVVHIVRDPRDVAVSQREAWGTPTLAAAGRWRREQRIEQDLESLVHPSRFTTVRYKDLVTDPKPQIERVCQFLDLPYTERMLSPHERKHKGFAQRETHKLRTLEPITKARIGRYREKLGPTRLAAIEHLCHEQMARFGYEPDTRPGLHRSLATAAMVGPLLSSRIAARNPARRLIRQSQRSGDRSNASANEE
jgi:hypothetical protein